MNVYYFGWCLSQVCNFQSQLSPASFVKFQSGGTGRNIDIGAFRNLQIFVGPSPLLPYSPPLHPRKKGIDDSDYQDGELCNDGKSFITGHWGLGILLGAVGFGCGFSALWQFDESFTSVVRSFGYWLLCLVCFGFGIYGIISTTFKGCEEKANMH